MGYGGPRYGKHSKVQVHSDADEFAVDLDVDKFHLVTWNRDAFKRLVLEEKTKEMIHALVDIQTATKKMDDIITGKGNGLIVLLHGSPGTGKTLTAER